MSVTLASPRDTLPPHDLNSARAPGPPHFLTAHPGPQELVWRRKFRCGGLQASVEDTQLGGRGQGGGDPGRGYRREGPSAGLGAPGKGLWAECYGSAHPEPSSLRGQERGPPPHSTSSARTVGPCSAAVTQSPALSSGRGHSWRDSLRETQVSSSPRPGRRPVSPAPSTHCLQTGEMAPDVPNREGGLDCFQSYSHVQHQLWGIPRDSLTLFSPCWGHRIPGRMRSSLTPLGPSVSRDRVITSFPKVGRP